MCLLSSTKFWPVCEAQAWGFLPWLGSPWPKKPSEPAGKKVEVQVLSCMVFMSFQCNGLGVLALVGVTLAKEALRACMTNASYIIYYA
jgi:hypothetical protein